MLRADPQQIFLTCLPQQDSRFEEEKMLVHVTIMTLSYRNFFPMRLQQYEQKTVLR